MVSESRYLWIPFNLPEQSEDVGSRYNKKCGLQLIYEINHVPHVHLEFLDFKETIDFDIRSGMRLVEGNLGDLARLVLYNLSKEFTIEHGFNGALKMHNPDEQLDPCPFLRALVMAFTEANNIKFGWGDVDIIVDKIMIEHGSLVYNILDESQFYSTHDNDV